MKRPKFIFITGGVCSSLGKGLTAASIASLLEARGLKVGLQKVDPYLNVDPGTMSPFQHGEVFVLDDGSECDLDLGHYERFTNLRLSKESSFSAGKVYKTVIDNERKGNYLGQTVQVVPHITNEIKKRMIAEAMKVDVLICEIGGTVGDIESLPFIESLRQLRHSYDQSDVFNIHLTLIPYLAAAEELKTKPTQHSVQKLREIGIQPEMLVCRSERPLTQELKSKLSLFCNMKEDFIIEEQDAQVSIYEVPITLSKQDVDHKIINSLDLQQRFPPTDLNNEHLVNWQRIVNIIGNADKVVEIAVVGKYTNLQDSYKSIYEAITHGAVGNEIRIKIREIKAELLLTHSHAAHEMLDGIDGMVVPGGFGERGIEGKVKAIQYARENKIPFLGICLGMQVAAVEFARNVIGLENASSREADGKCNHNIIDLLPGQDPFFYKGGTMRLGAKDLYMTPGKAQTAYNKVTISERHRHRYCFNRIDYEQQFSHAGFRITGHSNEGLTEIIALHYSLTFTFFNL